MKQNWVIISIIYFITLYSYVENKSVLVKREVYSSIDPLKQDVHHVDPRDKRKVDAVYGVKNAVLGFVFNKINSFIDQKTHWIDQLDKTNIAKNKAHGIEPPQDPVVSLSGIISGVIGQKLQAAGPLISIVTSKLSHGSSSGGQGHGSGGFNLGAILGASSGGGGSNGHNNEVAHGDATAFTTGYGY